VLATHTVPARTRDPRLTRTPWCASSGHDGSTPTRFLGCTSPPGPWILERTESGDGLHITLCVRRRAADSQSCDHMRGTVGRGARGAAPAMYRARCRAMTQGEPFSPEEGPGAGPAAGGCASGRDLARVSRALAVPRARAGRGLDCRTGRRESAWRKAKQVTHEATSPGTTAPSLRRRALYTRATRPRSRPVSSSHSGGSSHACATRPSSRSTS